MGISIDGNFQISGTVDLVGLKEHMAMNQYLKDSCIFDAIEEGYIGSFSDESFYLEQQEEFFEILPSFIKEGQVTCELSCLESDYEMETYVINKDGIKEHIIIENEDI